MYKLGIDVGGTNTDAVLIDENLQVVAAVKNPTSGDIYMGIMGAVDAVLDESGVDRTLIGQAMLGTTQCTNAIVERKGLAPIAILRIGAPATVGIPPMVDWADDIAAVCVDALIIEGGFEYDGKRLAEFDEAACRAFFEGVRGRVEAVAVSSVFSTVRNDDELRAAEIAREVLGEDVHVSIGLVVSGVLAGAERLVDGDFDLIFRQGVALGLFDGGRKRCVVVGIRVAAFFRSHRDVARQLGEQGRALRILRRLAMFRCSPL